MASHPFSLRRFVDLAENESRHGKDLAKIVPGVASALKDLRGLRSAYWDEVRGLEPESAGRAAAREKYLEDRRELRMKRDEALESSLQVALDLFQTKLADKSFTWGLKEGPLLGKRQTYQIDPAIDVIFPNREATDLLREAVGTVMASRNGTVRALKHALQKRYAHAVYRIDIKAFFDSIPHTKLREKLGELEGVDQITRELVVTLLREYGELSGQMLGVPQGVGLSSQLAELYLRDFDKAMRSFPGVIFYARYVDDIILVLEGEGERADAEQEIDRLLRGLELEVNRADRKFTSFTSDQAGNYGSNSVEYLGYKFTRKDGKLVTGLTESRAARRKKRLQAAFDLWLSKNPTRKTSNSGDEGLLIDRVRFLAGNTALKNSKANVAVGIYFSNSALDPDALELKDLDALLRDLVKTNKSRASPLLLKRLRAISFERSFNERTFIRFKQKRLEQIVQCWKEEQ